jgi:hypothetical protein
VLLAVLVGAALVVDLKLLVQQELQIVVVVVEVQVQVLEVN